MQTKEELNSKLQELFDKNKEITTQQAEMLRAKANTAFDKLKHRMPVSSKFVTTEFSRHKITLLKDNTIIINELKEDQAKSLFDRICQLT